MAESIIEKCIGQVNNRFKLALLASQRTHDLNTGARSSIQTAEFKGHKNTIISLYEIAERQVDVYELFSLLVSRCKGYMKGNISNTNNLERLLSSFNDRFNISSSAGQESTNIQDNKVKSEMDNQDDKDDRKQIK
ncbi:DNA-directed RNA polymerase subunit omega [Wolbachia endosymbiont of Dirofilaria (Dirofilaria) immitis]|uniref:DNA-directed RNA polymerase subunit omega n=1 Tax=Wolbachia endosymbiont of Dirofilaria (Dirofilaria) immitis TaxID=1812115 RepID=UPI00158F3B92|nr:DNA-directed RNA polymerase subunit omega [Wolbachia endosymbiont of Dirofilaria (Dirofilaria) immitis]QKX02471.1 DNA-directed RNA polymerase subunit omega [Wolbachia endosymbiont of Dirofilaria (Dirofilaria) immitis]